MRAPIISRITAFLTEIAIEPIRRVSSRFIQTAPDECPSKPRRRSAKLAVFMFFAFCVFAVIAIARPRNTIVAACGIPYGVAYVTFVGWVIYDLIKSKCTAVLR
jgi:nitrate reductase NapE component